MLRICFTVFIVILLQYTTSAQIRSYLRFSTDQGLAGDNIYCLQQDKDGFLWIATATGVSRFDGTAFKTFTTKDGLPANEVPWLFIDKRNRVWMGAFNNEICYYYQGAIHNSSNDTLLKQIRQLSRHKRNAVYTKHENIYEFDGISFAEDAAGNMMIKSKDEIFYIDTQHHVRKYNMPYSGPAFFKPVALNNTLPIEIIDTSLWKYKVTQHRTEAVYPGFIALEAHTAITSEKGWLNRCLVLYSEKGIQRISSSYMNSFDVLTASRLLLNGIKGSVFFDLKTQKITDTLLAGINVNVSIIDKDSSIWLGSNGGGLYYFPHRAGHYIQQPGRDRTPLQVYQFYVYKDELWMGSNNWQFWKLNTSKASIDNQGTIKKMSTYLILPPEGNMMCSPESGLLSVFRNQKDLLKGHHNAKSIMNVKDTMIVAYHNKIDRFLFPGTVLDSVGFNERIICAYYLNGQYYAGTLKGLYKITKGHTHDHITELKPIITDAVNAIAYSYKNGLLWVSTPENGIYCIRNDRVIHHFNKEKGLSSSICNCLFTDGIKVYVGTIDGLNIIDPDQGFSINRYYTLDGLPSDNVNCIYARDGKVWLGTAEGLSVIEPGGAARNHFFNLIMDQVIVSGQQIATAGNAVLAPDDNNIRFNYAGITFLSRHQVQYTYRLLGLDEQWQTTDQPYLQYPSLPSGKYTFELYATDRFGVRSNRIIFSFAIKQQWWEYGWLQALAAITLLGLAFVLTWQRMRKIQRRKQEKIELKEKILELEQLALRARMNPHFIFNSLNSFYQYVIDQDLEGASKFMSDFSKLIRQLFETASLYEIALYKEIDFLNTYMELERTKLRKIFSYTVSVQPDIYTEELIIPSFVIQPFLENAIRHGIQNRGDALGRISLRITLSGDILKLEIEDNGPGRAYSLALKSRNGSMHHSKGMHLIAERIDLYNKIHQSNVRFDIIDHTEPASGTLVIIYFPLKNPI
ncbi:Sensor histidine kinase YehU [compost metagenome]